MRKLWLGWLLLLAGLVTAGRAAELAPAPDGTCSVVVIPDTQAYRTAAGKTAGKEDLGPLTNRIFENHCRWIVANLERQKIAFVSHVGDIVDINNEAQWTEARRCLDLLHGKVPYSLTPGNHDMTGAGDSALFQQFCGSAGFRAFPWYGGSFAADPARPQHSGNNANSWQVFEGAGLRFVHVSLECNAPDDVLAWADGVLRQHVDRLALVTTHMDLGPVTKPVAAEEYFTLPKGRMTWSKTHGERGNTPAQAWQKCFRKHPNLRLIFSGDQSRTTAARLTTTGDAGNPVHALMSDYTSSGPLRIYRFQPAVNQVEVITWDTSRELLVESTAYVPAREQHQFTLPVTWRP
ncbi:MAG: metallophosphoesterase [Fimbriimonadaceae bacterium]|nr:metallophosphoesterase [Fimbriimonadaceae bacterium]